MKKSFIEAMFEGHFRESFFRDPDAKPQFVTEEGPLEILIGHLSEEDRALLEAHLHENDSYWDDQIFKLLARGFRLGIKIGFECAQTDTL